MAQMTRRERAAAMRRWTGGPPPRRTTRWVWWGTGALALAIVVVGAVLVVRSGRGSPTTPAAASSADAHAPAALVRAADRVGFHPTTEPGAGEIEGKPASDAPATTSTELLPVGRRAPGFTLRTPQGQAVSLADQRGKAVLLEFFTTWCPHCNAEAPHLRRLGTSLGTRRYAFLTVNADSEGAPSVFAFHRYYGLPYPALLDPGGAPGSFDGQGGSGRVTSEYGVEAYPTFYVLSPTGRVVWRGDGEQPDALLRAELVRAAGGDA
jgi:peroxiredoxin